MDEFWGHSVLQAIPPSLGKCARRSGTMAIATQTSRVHNGFIYRYIELVPSWLTHFDMFRFA